MCNRRSLRWIIVSLTVGLGLSACGLRTAPAVEVRAGAPAQSAAMQPEPVPAVAAATPELLAQAPAKTAPRGEVAARQAVPATQVAPVVATAAKPAAEPAAGWRVPLLRPLAVAPGPVRQS